jgi:hypothetical protein
MKKYLYLVILCLVASLPLAGPFALLPLHEELAGFLHRQLAYRVIADRVTQDATTDMERVLAIMAFVHLNEAQPDDWGLAEDRHVLHDLARHVGWCDQKANAMAHLLMPISISAHMVMFPCHTFAEVVVDGRSLLFDPKHNSYFFERGMPGQLASLTELLSRPQDLMTRHGEDMVAYEDADILTCGRPNHWTTPEETLSPTKKLLDRWMGLAFRIGGHGYAQAINRWYLRIAPDKEDNVYTARMLDLFGENDEAKKGLSTLTGNRAVFFLFKLQVETGDYLNAPATLKKMDARPSDKTDVLYAMVMTDYLTKLGTMEGSELMRLFGTDEVGINDLFDLLDGPEVQQWLVSQDRADTF